MKFTLALLADFPGTKTVCILLAPDALYTKNINSTHISQMFVRDQFSSVDIMVTVVVKGIELSSCVIATLVANFLAQRADNKLPYIIEIDDPGLVAGQASKS